MEDSGVPERTYSPVPRTKYLAVVALAALCLSLVELSYVFELPFESAALSVIYVVYYLGLFGRKG